MPPYTLKDLAQAGYVMGLPTIGEVASHMRSHYDAYFLIEDIESQVGEFDDMVASHQEASIFLWLTDEDKRRLDDELEKAMNEGPENEEETRGEEEAPGDAPAVDEDDHADDGLGPEGST